MQYLVQNMLVDINLYLYFVSSVDWSAVHQGDSAVAGGKVDRRAAGSVAAAFQIHELGHEVIY